ncbi:MAG: terminase small subunit [Chloroflexi bacterium]|nr:terminase small subunit [Chloroflexota bacterium]
MNEHNLTDRQERFCQEYIIDNNATQAYIRAGYAVNGATVNASRLLAKDNVQERIQELREAKRKLYSADAEDAKIKLWDIAENAKAERDKIGALAQLARMEPGWIPKDTTAPQHKAGIMYLPHPTISQMCQSCKYTYEQVEGLESEQTVQNDDEEWPEVTNGHRLE